MSSLTLLSIHCGEPEKLTDHKGRSYQSSIKRPEVTDSVQVSFSGFKGDLCEFEDHRTRDRAVCFFAEEGYEEIETHYGQKLERPAFGENIRIQGMSDREICIGDQIKIEDVILEVSHPREPCANVVKASGLSDLVKVMCRLPVTGFLARVKDSGILSYKSKAEVISRPNPDVSIHYLNETLYKEFKDSERVEKVLNIPQLADNWRFSLRKKSKLALKN